jgi:hypothetical protein
MLARLEHEEILGHSAYALTILRQADVHVRDFTEKAPMGTPNYRFRPLRDFLMRKEGVVFIISREWDGVPPDGWALFLRRRGVALVRSQILTVSSGFPAVIA